MLRRACNWLFVSLVLPPLGQHVTSFVLAEVLPFRGPEALRTVSVVMVLVHLLVATPLTLLALPGAWVLARWLKDTQPRAARLVQGLAALFAVLVVLTLLARFVLTLPYQPVREATDMTRLALGLGVALLLQRNKGGAPRWLPLAATSAAVVALILHMANLVTEVFDHEWLLGAHSTAAALLGGLLWFVGFPSRSRPGTWSRARYPS